MHVERHLFHSDLDRAGGARLLAWCVAHGADSFTVSVIGSEPQLAVVAAALEQSLRPFAVEPRRIRASAPPAPGNNWIHPAQLWELNDASAAILSLSRRSTRTLSGLG